MIVAFLPLCKGCFLQCKSGKLSQLELRDGLGVATYNAATTKIDFSPGVPKSRLPGTHRPNSFKKVDASKKALVFHVGQSIPGLASLVSEVLASPAADPESASSIIDGGGSTAELSTISDQARVAVRFGCADTIPVLTAIDSTRVVFYVDSGAGQSLCSVGTAFSELRPCRVEVTGVAGSLLIYGCGTASFVVRGHDGRSLIMVIPNCLYGRCEFNLLSVSQLHQVHGNHVDFSLTSPAIVLSPPSGVIRPSARVPLLLEDGKRIVQ